ncbi:MAG: DUF2934 domain-containing protein [Burkholderiales bacterium]
MAKAGKDRPASGAKSANAKTSPPKSGGVKSASPRPPQARKTPDAAPDAPETRSAERPTAAGRDSRLSPEAVYRLIQESAYFKAKARGFAPGHEVQDWVEAEQEVRRRLEGGF